MQYVFYIFFNFLSNFCKSLILSPNSPIFPANAPKCSQMLVYPHLSANISDDKKYTHQHGIRKLARHEPHAPEKKKKHSAKHSLNSP